jgi:hypothetical protein
LKENCHGESRDLPFADAAVRQALNEGRDIGGVELAAVTLGADDLLRQETQ